MYATGSDNWNDITSEFGRFAPREVLVGGGAISADGLQSFLKERLEALIEPMPEECFEAQRSAERIQEHFKMQDFDAAGLTDLPCTVQCLGGLLDYLEQTQKASLSSLNQLQVYHQGQYMELDLIARRNLELCETMRTKEKKGTLLWVLDHTRTAMGSRLIRQWIEKPLYNPLHIARRQQAVGALCDDVIARTALTDALKRVFDMERLIGRVAYGTANCRDLRALSAAISCLPEIKTQAALFGQAMLRELTGKIDLLEDIRALVEQAIVDEPPILLREGGMIRKGFNEEIDRLRDLASGGKGKIAEIEQAERERTGISKLKIGYNHVFGYYIEVSNSYKSMVPETYIRKQTLTSGERYITQELKELESKILGAHERLIALEHRLFSELLETIGGQLDRIQRTANAVAELDVLAALAQVAAENNYCRPVVDDSDELTITEGRHPVVEQMLKGSLFVPNDTRLNCTTDRCLIITGPNMAGKSTYMRQNALIALMAQIGSFVPASSCHVGVVDAIFTRIGASDDLAAGQSTFMVEMTEVAEILKNATPKSLVVLDEIGRGTSTFDGMSIARAVVEHISDPAKGLGCKTLFATHYHELTDLEGAIEGVKNYNIAVKKRGEDITFLRRIVRGPADDSYGIEVAKLAGLPGSVTRRAHEVLRTLEASAPKNKVEQMDFDALQEYNSPAVPSEMMEKLEAVDVETLTPIEALNFLYELKKTLRGSLNG